MASLISSGTTAGALEFLDLLIDKGRASSGSVVPLKTVLRQVLSVVDGDKWKEVDIRSINIQDHISRFSTLTAGKYNSDSLRTYQSRLKRAVSWYTSFLADPGWVPPKAGSAQRAQKPIAEAPQTAHKQTVDIANREQNSEIPPKDSAVAESLVAYPFPLRANKMVQLYLPADLTALEAKRLGKFLESLSVDVDIED